jgi:hypothetical protein
MRYVMKCAECGRNFQDYDSAPRLWCSVWCETAGAREAVIIDSARAEGASAGAQSERAAVLAWLRAVEDEGRGSTWQWADAIERGEHVVK